MNHLVSELKKIYPDLVGLKESTIETHGEIVGYESTFYNKDGRAIAGGTSPEKKPQDGLQLRRHLSGDFIEKFRMTHF
jgi:hypothetical protein